MCARLAVCMRLLHALPAAEKGSLACGAGAGTFRRSCTMTCPRYCTICQAKRGTDKRFLSYLCGRPVSYVRHGVYACTVLAARRKIWARRLPQLVWRSKDRTGPRAGFGRLSGQVIHRLSRLRHRWQDQPSQVQVAACAWHTRL